MTDSSQKWIEAGYLLFALEGPEGVNVEKLSRHLGMNKSGFYHHFGDREVFLNRLFEHHNFISIEFYEEALLLERFYPDYLDLIFKYKTSLFVQLHLRSRIENPLFRKEFERVARRNEKALLPLWAAYLKLEDKPELAFDLWNILRDVFFLRAKVDTLTLELIYSIVKEFTSILEVFRKHASKNQFS